MAKTCALGFLILASTTTAFFAIPDPLAPDPNAPRPIRARDSIRIDEMTWMEVRDALAAGKDTVIVATGGVEQSGPYLVTGKHDVILRGTTEAIARKLGNALVAPILCFVPEGEIQPPTLHMKYPGTISLSETTYEQLLEELCACFRAHGFRRVILIGDSGDNQVGMRRVARRLSKRWPNDRTRFQYIPEYYDYPAVARWLEQQGIKQIPEGLHDDFAITAQMIAVDPESVRMAERIAAGKFNINGIDLSPPERTIAWGRRIIEFRADATVAAIRKTTAAEAPK